MAKLSFFLANLLEKLHIPAAVAVLGLGRSWLPQGAYFLVLGGTVLLQNRYKECPLNRIVVWLKKKYQPDFQYQKEKTFIWQFYNRYGGIGAVVVFLFWVAVSWCFGRIF